MAVKTYLEEAIESIVYDGLGDWRVQNIQNYSTEKSMFPYQIEALKNAIKVIYSYYKDGETHPEALYELCRAEGMPVHSFDILENADDDARSKFDRLSKHYPITTRAGVNRIDEKVLFNRMCFWMATGSGKTLVLTKMIEILDYFQRKKLIPRKDIMVLLPSEKIQAQFEREIYSYNIGKDRPINLMSLKKYEDEKNGFAYELENKIPVFVYRSDLLSNSETTKRVDTFTYDNNGEWYIFMDEAHKGDKEDSLRQDYITVLSRNGFLFNFSATYTDAIDFATTCYNFNLEKFIEAKYGKNIYLSNSSYNFLRGHNDLDAQEKQLQVFKSLITFTLVKKAKKEGYYHHPLMVTLVNEVNTQDSDTDMFFAELGKIASGQIDKKLFETAKEQLYDEFLKNKVFQFGTESLILSDGVIKGRLDEITIEDILKLVYNSNTFGKIEVIEGEKGKEFALKLESSDSPFALFRIGDASQYIKEKLSDNYLIMRGYEEKHFFDSLNYNEGACFNILIGSRMFYEGWDSNRPNVMNFINIGKGDAKKFVLQSLGRGVRIEPTPNNRQRLRVTDSNKEQLLETLFIFATNKNSVATILETMDTQKSEEKNIVLKANDKAFDLLIPYYEATSENLEADSIAKFNISDAAYERFCKYLSSFSDNLIYLKTNISKENLQLLRRSVNDRSLLFRSNQAFNYLDMDMLTDKIINYISINDKKVAGIKELSNEIMHFQHIKISKDRVANYENEILSFMESSAPMDKKDLALKFANGEITEEEFTKGLKQAETDKDIGDLKILKLSQHYYMPLILSKHDKLDYMKHIIDVKSEYDFIINLDKHIKNNHFDFDWMFSKIDQTIDDRNIAMPYFSTRDNNYHDFYPDFIFWIKKNNEYKIIFVDPKGTEYASYLSKIDAFEKLFLENGKPKIFKYKGYDVSLDLKLYFDGEGTIPNKYKSYWLTNDNFCWLS